ncbi:PASTA domain-containing protein [Embleya sp. NBC_00896]|uniref:PASTA domain-containing protein n=1 Tax=Embleya sp. NBC_00896 TaxID=2975961 RepID=UPI003870551D|nr:PASTA domain-containing protein [Embleya sp. NBC_00896]
MVHCLLCGTPYLETDAYCPGEQCGTDLHGQRMGDPACAVQAWCEPRRITAAPGETVVVTLTLRNAGSAPDRYDPEVPRDAGRRIGLDTAGPPDVYPGEERVWTIIYTVPHDIAESLAPSSLFGLGDVGTDSGGSAFEEASRVVEESDIPIRVVSTRDMRVAACAPFSVRVVSTDRDRDPTGGRPRPAGAPVDPYDDDRSGGRRKGRIAGAAAATVAAIVVALLVGMAMAGSGGDKKPAAKTSVGPSAQSSGSTRPTGDPTNEAPVTSTPDASDSASPSTSAPGKLTVPNVVGMTEAQGVALLREKGFRGTVRGTGGTIASTDPAAGRKVDRDKAEILVVMSGAAASTSAAPQQTAVPVVVGRSTSEATARLRAVGLRAAVEEVVSSAAPDTVIGSDPAAGKLVPNGSTVTLTVAKPAPTSAPPTTEVPAVTRLTVDGARARLRESGLSLVADHEQSTCLITSQQPRQGVEVSVGSSVSVTVPLECG